MANDEGGEKTEEPTGHKLGKAREKGQVGQSMEVTSAIILLVAGSVLVVWSPYIWERLAGMYTYYVWRIAEFDITTVDIWPWFYTAIREVLIMIMPLAFAVALTGVAVNLYQMGGLVISTDNIQFKLSNIDPIKGFKNMFKLKSLVDLVKNTVKLAIIGRLCYSVINGYMEDFTVMIDMQPVEMALFTLKVTMEMYFKVVLTLLIMAFFDYAYQKWQFKRDMRMSKQEIKDESKNMEGDPKVKARIRQIQMEGARKRMLGDVPKADVVVTNPTHYAIALVYDASLAQAPLVLAKGQDLLAQRIKDIAKEAKVPVVENKPLAQALYKVAEVGQIIPFEFYKAVAEVLSYVYKLKGRGPSGRK
ncbi:flagellar biosynthesis protein FlhB [Deltaproteobacteria bacterium Smac51]|nr:flagellar biosynthesis protein FlhB [Deltaproteobacteria bacterium Smac51]